MNTRCLWLCAGLLFAALATTGFAQRQTLALPDGWRFIKQDAGLQADASQWEAVTIPHCWNNLDAQDGPDPAAKPARADYYRGACWYARALDIPADWKEKRVFLRFEAAATAAKVFLNGQPVGEHRGAFTAFCFEITPRVEFGGANELRVQVDNSPVQDLAPLSGDFNMHGGIYRPVSLIVTDPVCVSPLDRGSLGLSATVKSLQKDGAAVEVTTKILTTDAARGFDGFYLSIQDAEGREVMGQTTKAQLGAGFDHTLTSSLSIPNPHLWQGRKDPYLYTVAARLYRGGKVVDEVTQPLGIRTVEITQDKGFLLNGEPYPLHGVNRHQEKADKGWALSAADDEEDLQMIRDMGATVIRLAHYPQSERFHNLCDRLGMLVWDEVPFVNEVPHPGGKPPVVGQSTPEFDANLEQQLREMIAQRVNHPSVFAWGLFNELQRVDSPVAVPLVAHLKEVAHALDPTRPTVSAANNLKKPTNRSADWPCHNIYPFWYKEYTDDPAKLIAEILAEQEGKRFAISEYGAGGNPRQHEEGEPKKPDQAGQWHPEEWQSYAHERDWAAFQADPHLWGTFIWAMFDFASDKRNEGEQPGINDKGLVTHDRKLKKDAYFFYQANWTSEPMVHIASSRATPRKQPATEVKVYTNCPEVELKVNGKSLGQAKPDEIRVARWKDVALQPGKNTIEVTAVPSPDRPPVKDACEWVLEAPQP